MSTNFTSKDIITRTCFGVVICVAFCIGLALLLNTVGETADQAPIRGLELTIDKTRKEELYLQLRKFADKHSFRILIRDVDVSDGPSGKGFFVEMNRSDIQILAIGQPSAPLKVSIDFYYGDSTNPIAKETADVLFDDLKSFVSDIPSVIFSKETSK